MTKVKSALNAEGFGTDEDGNAFVVYIVEVRATDPAGIPGANPAVTVNSGVVTVNISRHRRERCAGGDCSSSATCHRPLRRLSGMITTPLETYHCDRR